LLEVGGDEKADIS